jgi:hypothetical protein
MLLLIVILFLFWAVLAGLLTAWSVWFQGYIYTEPAIGLTWRGPAAAGAISAVVLAWVVVDYRSVNGPTAVGRYRSLFEFTASEEIKPFPELHVPRPGGFDVYKLRPGTGRPEYRLSGLPSGRLLPDRPEKIIIPEGEGTSTFEPERDGQGNFKVRQGEYLRYRDAKGRVMVESSLGQLTAFRGTTFFVNLLLNFLLLADLFLCGWLLLRFHWGIALLQAVILWLALLLFVLPPILSTAERVAQTRAVPKG